MHPINEKIMATKNAIEQEPEKKIEEALSKSGQFIEDNSKTILISFFGVCLIVCLVFAYLFMYKAPREEEAAENMYKAMAMFQQDSLEAALNGGSNFMGLLEISETYSGTPQANIANHTIGICMLNLGRYEDAIVYLQKFNDVDGTLGEIVTAQNTGLLGDAYAQKGDNDKALQMYENAAKFDNADSAPMFLFKAAAINCTKGDYSKALEQYLKIRNEYPTSSYARTIEKYIAMARQAAGK